MPTVPGGRLVVVMVRVGGSTVRVYALDAVRFALSVTVTVKSRGPAAVGVPVIAPAALSDSPAGSAPLLMVNRLAPLPPVASTAAE
jgi:hypothetical protein